MSNLWAHALGLQTKQCYYFTLVYGGAGVGKTRLVYEVSRSMASTFEHMLFSTEIVQTDETTTGSSFSSGSSHKARPTNCVLDQVSSTFSFIHHLFTDLACRDAITRDEEVKKVFANVSLGLHLACSFFQIGSIYDLLDNMKSHNCFDNLIHILMVYTLDAVCSLYPSIFLKAKC